MTGQHNGLPILQDPDGIEFVRLMNLPKNHVYTAEEEYFLFIYFRNLKETAIKHTTQALEHYYNPTIDEHYKAYKEKARL